MGKLKSIMNTVIANFYLHMKIICVFILYYISNEEKDNLYD